MKCILKGLSQSDPYSGEMKPFETIYNGIPEACYMWASGYKHCFLEDCSLYYLENCIEVPDHITDKYYDKYYYGRYYFDENGEEIGKISWYITYFTIYHSSNDSQVNFEKVGILRKK